MNKLTDLDESILSTAKKMILEKGILETDMKDIAKEIGCSRSTLYRHFSSKGDILLVLADNALDIIRNAQIIPKEYRFSNGFEAFSWQMNSMLDAVLKNTEELIFLRDFDTLYYRYYVSVSETQDFKNKIKGSSKTSPLQKSFNLGIQDGSIVSPKDPELFILMVFQSFIALSERVIPVEKSYIECFGYGQEILREYVRSTVELVRVK